MLYIYARSISTILKGRVSVLWTFLNSVYWRFMSVCMYVETSETKTLTNWIRQFCAQCSNDNVSWNLSQIFLLSIIRTFSKDKYLHFPVPSQIFSRSNPDPYKYLGMINTRSFIFQSSILDPSYMLAPSSIPGHLEHCSKIIISTTIKRPN